MRPPHRLPPHDSGQTPCHVAARLCCAETPTIIRSLLTASTGKPLKQGEHSNPRRALSPTDKILLETSAIFLECGTLEPHTSVETIRWNYPLIIRCYIRWSGSTSRSTSRSTLSHPRTNPTQPYPYPRIKLKGVSWRAPRRSRCSASLSPSTRPQRCRTTGGASSCSCAGR